MFPCNPQKKSKNEKKIGPQVDTQAIQQKLEEGLPLPLLKIDTSSCYTSLGEIIRCKA